MKRIFRLFVSNPKDYANAKINIRLSLSSRFLLPFKNFNFCYSSLFAFYSYITVYWKAPRKWIYSSIKFEPNGLIKCVDS